MAYRFRTQVHGGSWDDARPWPLWLDGRGSGVPAMRAVRPRPGPVDGGNFGGKNAVAGVAAGLCGSN
jgi:hypothetical protein